MEEKMIYNGSLEELNSTMMPEFKYVIADHYFVSNGYYYQNQFLEGLEKELQEKEFDGLVNARTISLGNPIFMMEGTPIRRKNKK